MNHPAGLVGDAPATPTHAPATAAAPAARIPIPVTLPTRYDGQPLRHLSNSSYTLWTACPEAWRRKYILGRRSPQTAAMFLGSRVDDALTDYYRHILAHSEQLPLDEVLDRYRTGWKTQLQAEQERRGVVFDELDEHTLLELGAKALEATFDQLVPNLGMPVAVQRRIAFKLAPGIQWTIEGYLDLEIQRPDLDGEIVSEVVDYKVKGGDAIGQQRADRDPQASLYLAGRWLEGRPAERFAFAQALTPGRKRKHTTTSLVRTTRTVGQLRATLARIALAASQICALHERLGPDRPWALADPTSWKCSPRYCDHWPTCPGGAGL